MSILFLLNFSVFAQKIENITYWDWSQNRNISTKVIHIGWEHQYTSILNPGTASAKLVTYSSIKLNEYTASDLGILSEWTEWELVNTEPKPYADIKNLILLRDYTREYHRLHPFSGGQIGPNYIRVSSPPSNKNENYWFDENNNFNLFFKSYMVVP
jgi:hypothetical protein